MSDDILRQKAVDKIQKIYQQALLEKAKSQIQSFFPNTDKFIFLKSIDSETFEVGFLSYYTEEAVLTDIGESMGLSEDDIGNPCEYWEMTLGIEPDGSVYECYSGNNNPDKHPNWQQILEND